MASAMKMSYLTQQPNGNNTLQFYKLFIITSPFDIAITCIFINIIVFDTGTSI